MKHRVDRTLVTNHLGERDLRQRVLDYLVQTDDDGPDAAAPSVNARVEHTRIALAVRAQNVLVKHLDDLAQAYLARRSGQAIAALCPAYRVDKPGLVQQSHQLARVGRRDALACRDLRQRQALTRRQSGKLHQAPEPIFLLRRNLHKPFSVKDFLRCLYSNYP